MCFLPLDGSPLASTDSEVTASDHKTRIVSIDYDPYSQREVEQHTNNDYIASQSSAQWSYMLTIEVPEELSTWEEGDDVPVQMTLQEVAPIAYLGAVPALLVQLANVVVLMVGTLLIMNGQFTAGMLLAFQGFLFAFMAPVNSLVNLGQTIQETRTQMERVQDVLNYDVDVLDTRDESENGQDTTQGLSKLSGSIDIKGLTFGYSRLEKPTVEGLDLHAEPGQWIALVGGSGSGKSTIAKLISGLYKPWEGEIRLDGKLLEDIPREQLRGSLAVVDQDIMMFAGTVNSNVSLWDASIEDFDVITACCDADIHSEILARENGYRSAVLPNGRNFSGGQLQRLEIARVLAQDPTIAILDEATSALDAKTEEKVIQSIRKREITCIVVAHRLSTIRDCDEIIVLDHGRVAERGTHAELLALDGAYAELVRND